MSNKEREQIQKMSEAMQMLAETLDGFLKDLIGEPTGFVLVVSVAHTAQYVSNCERKDGSEMIRDLLARWDAGRADIPASYNPALAPGALGHYDVTFTHKRGEIADLTFEDVPAESPKDAERRARVHLSIPDAWTFTGAVAVPKEQP